MAKVLFIGDMHLKINRFDLTLRFLSWINKLIEEQKPDLVVNLGDSWDTHAVIRSEVACEFMAHVYQTLDLGIPYVYLVGNHDMYKPNDPKYHAMLPYKDKIKNLYVIDQITNLFDITFVPYQHDSTKFPKNTLPICVAHQTFIGADYGAMRTTEGVDARGINGCDIIISGHIHTKSVLGSVVYVGSPFSQSASDIDEVKGITIFDTCTYKTTFVECPLPMWKRLTFKFDQSSDVGVLQQLLTETVSGSKDHWVLELEGPKAEIVSFLNSEEYLMTVKNVDVKVKSKFVDKDKKKMSIESKSIDYIVSEYVDKVYDGSLPKEKIKSMAIAVLTESKNLA